MSDEKKFFESMESDILNANIPEEEKSKLMKNLLNLKKQKINLMITGATGVGKSSTINALFNTEKAKVGVGTDPETMEITRYELDNLVLWDSPGLGDGKEADNRHAKNIINKLYEKDEHGNLLIDLVLVILDGSTRDLGTSYELINEVIIPNLGENKEGRILIAINQADAAMKGRYWDSDNNRPEPPLQKFLDEKAESVKRRIKEATGLEVSPIYYSAGFKFEDMPQTPPYNLAKLLYYIIEHTPKEKRLVYAENMNTDRRMWKDNDDYKNYRKSILAQFGEVVSDIGSAIYNAGKTVVDTVCDWGRSAWNIAQFGEVVSDIGSAIYNAGKTVVDTVCDWGKICVEHSNINIQLVNYVVRMLLQPPHVMNLESPKAAAVEH